MESNCAFLAFQTEVLARWFSHLIDKPITILDYGCGDGTMAHFISNAFFKSRVYATDSAASMLEQARSDLPHITFFDCQQAHTLVGTFDLIYMSMVLHHNDYEQQPVLIELLLKMLKPGGKLVIFELNPLNKEVKEEFENNPEEKYAAMIYPWDLYRMVRLKSSCYIRFCSQAPQWLERFMVVAPLYAVVAEQ